MIAELSKEIDSELDPSGVMEIVRRFNRNGGQTTTSSSPTSTSTTTTSTTTGTKTSSSKPKNILREFNKMANTDTTTSTSTRSSTTSSKRRGRSRSGKGDVSYSKPCAKPINGTIKFSSGLKSGLIVNPSEPVSKSDWSMLFLQSGELFDLDNTSTSFYEYIESNIYPMVERTVQSELNYSYNFDFSVFKGWFKAVSRALQIHYMCDSITAVGNNGSTTNKGELYLRSMITSPIRLRLNALAIKLGKQAIPPRVVEMIRMAYQSYKFAELETTPHYRLNYRNLFSPVPASDETSPRTGSISTVIIDKAIEDLDEHSNIGNKIYQAMKDWRVEGECLPPSFSKATYDLNFRTFWYNGASVYTDTNNDLQITRSGVDTQNFRYFLYKDFNKFDGLYFSMCSFRNTADLPGLTRPGIWNPTNVFPASTSLKCSLWYYDGTSIAPFIFTNNTQNVWQLIDMYTVPVKIGSGPWLDGINLNGSTHIAQECTFNTFKELVYMTSRWLFD
jgi:hypothetical protein